VSVSSHTRRFLDYFGLEQDNGRPLLIVESKRPSSELPERSVSLTNNNTSLRDSFAADPERGVAEIIARGLGGQSIPGEWHEWLTTLRDYVCSVQQQSGHTPCRVVITNGNWVVLFLDPTDAFIGEGFCDSAQILVYGNRDAIERRHAELFRTLEHRSLLSETRALTLGELRFAVTPGTIDHAMHGLRLMYIEEPGFFEPSPVIKVMPIVFLRTCYRSWLCVESRCEERLPHAASELRTHLDRIRELSSAFLKDIERVLGTQLSIASLAKHYADEESFDAMREVVECRYYAIPRAREFIIVTGEHTHYLLGPPVVNGQFLAVGHQCCRVRPY
jgi:hypothetical protein